MYSLVGSSSITSLLITNIFWILSKLTEVKHTAPHTTMSQLYLESKGLQIILYLMRYVIKLTVIRNELKWLITIPPFYDFSEVGIK